MGDPILYNQMQLNQKKKKIKFGESMALLRYCETSKKKDCFGLYA